MKTINSSLFPILRACYHDAISFQNEHLAILALQNSTSSVVDEHNRFSQAFRIAENTVWASSSTALLSSCLLFAYVCLLASVIAESIGVISHAADEVYLLAYLAVICNVQGRICDPLMIPCGICKRPSAELYL